MANSAQAKKRARQADNRRLNNSSQRSAMRSIVKKVINAIEAGDKTGAEAAYKNAVPAIDAGAGKGHLHKNTAARQKSRLNTRIRAMA
ncbi:MAG: 30S ribosomal protein S20 [Gammaproteobacteria bacterium]|nr:30S ribosomal protein S20 [Gammaproteobacteria bacterium]